MVLYPIGYTFLGSLTNLGTGHMLSKSQAIEQLLDRTYAPPNAERYAYRAFQSPAGVFAFVLQGRETLLVIDGKASPVDLADPRLIDDTADGQPDRVVTEEAGRETEYRALATRDIVALLPTLEEIRVRYDALTLGIDSLSEFRVRMPKYAYDAATETMADLETGMTYTSGPGHLHVHERRGDLSWIPSLDRVCQLRSPRDESADLRAIPARLPLDDRLRHAVGRSVFHARSRLGFAPQ